MDNTLRFIEKIADHDTLAEVTDPHGRLMLLMPWEQVFRQQLPCKIVVLIMRNQKRHMYLKQKIKADTRKKNSVWGLDMTVVTAGEARIDAAIRMGHKATGLKNIQPAELARLFWQNAPHMEVTFFHFLMPGSLPPLSESNETQMLVDADEVEGLLETAPESLSQEVKLIASTPFLFNE